MTLSWESSPPPPDAWMYCPVCYEAASDESPCRCDREMSEKLAAIFAARRAVQESPDAETLLHYADADPCGEDPDSDAYGRRKDLNRLHAEDNTYRPEGIIMWIVVCCLVTLGTLVGWWVGVGHGCS